MRFSDELSVFWVHDHGGSFYSTGREGKGEPNGRGRFYRRWPRDDDQHFKRHLGVGAHSAREEERGVHDQSHQGGEGGEGTENESETYQEFTEWDDEVEELHARQCRVLQERRPPALDGG